MSTDPPRSIDDSGDDVLPRGGDTTDSTPHSSSASSVPTTKTLTDPSPRLPRRIGHYHIKRMLASGGMGTIYEATQEKPRRVVAIKLMKQGIASKSALRRFEYESQILARLRHSGIAQIYEAGTHREESGTIPYFAMEYIPNALPITKYAEEKKLSIRQRLELFAPVCDAVQHGHQKGIIHRDLKPSNILVDSHGEVKIIDFGVARGTDSDMAVTTVQTDVGQLLGTLQYMSPEQCLADPHDIDTRSDVYTLGVVLYQLLSGKLPYVISSTRILEGTRIIREQQPTKMTTSDKALRGDVETIVFKAIQKDRDRRYQSAVELAQDIRRYLMGSAIAARPPSLAYQLRIFARRNKALFGAIAAVFVVLVAGVIASTSMYFRAERARAETVAERDRAREAEHKATAINEFLVNDMLASAGPEIAQGRTITVQEVLENAAWRVATAFRSEPKIEAAIRFTIGTTYVGLGLYDSAGLHLKAAEEIRRSELGDDHPDTLRTKTSLADLHRRQGRYLDAETAARQTLATQRRILGERHPDTLATLGILAQIQRTQGHFGEAEALHRAALRTQREVLGSDHPDALASMSNLAGLLQALGRHTEAEPLAREALETRRRTLGDQHPDTLSSILKLGLLLEAQGAHADAEALYRKNLDVNRRVHGSEHPLTLNMMNALGLTLMHQGRHAEAETVFRDTVDGKRRVRGDGHPSTLSSMQNLAYVLRAQGKKDSARPVASRIIAELKRAAERPDSGPMLLNDYAWMLLTCEPADLRDPGAALIAAKKAADASDPPNPVYLDTLALAYHDTGDLDKAIEVQRRALSLLPPGESSVRKDVEKSLTRYLDTKGAPVELEQFQREIVAHRRANLPKDDPAVASALVDLAQTLTKQERHREAEALLRESIEIRRKALGQHHWLIADAESLLGAALAGQGKSDDAETLLLTAYERIADHDNALPGRVRAALARLVEFYDSSGQSDKASQYRAALGQHD